MSGSKVIVAQLIHDDREVLRDYGSPNPAFGPAPGALLQGFADLNDVEVHVVSCLQRPVAAPEKLAPNIFYHALHVPNIGWLRTGYQGCIRAVRRKLRELQPDVVHGQGTERDCAMTAVFSGFRNVLTIHGNMRQLARLSRARPFSFGWCQARLEAFALPRTGGVVCISSHTQRLVQSVARRTWVLPNAIDEPFFQVRRQPATNRVVLCIANILSHKNQNALMRSLDAVGGTQQFELRFFGKAGEGDPYAREFFELLKARPWCHYAGHADRARLREELAGAAFVVLPSLEDNCPMVVLEAAAAGVPVAAARIGGIPDLIEDGRTGRLFDPSSAASMASAVEEFLTHPSQAEGFALTAQAEAARRFRPREVARRHVEIYRELIEADSQR